jgi:hypothetical protein
MAGPLMLGGARCLDASRGWCLVCVDWMQGSGYLLY